MTERTKLDALKALVNMTVITSDKQQKERDALVQEITALILDKPEEPFTRMQIIKNGLTLMMQECYAHDLCTECPLNKAGCDYDCFGEVLTDLDLSCIPD